VELPARPLRGPEDRPARAPVALAKRGNGNSTSAAARICAEPYDSLQRPTGPLRRCELLPVGFLEDAEAVRAREDLADMLGPADLAYLEACRAADSARRNRELEEARKLAEAQRLAAEHQKEVARRTRSG